MNDYDNDEYDYKDFNDLMQESERQLWHEHAPSDYIYLVDIEDILNESEKTQGVFDTEDEAIEEAFRICKKMSRKKRETVKVYINAALPDEGDDTFVRIATVWDSDHYYKEN